MKINSIGQDADFRTTTMVQDQKDRTFADKLKAVQDSAQGKPEGADEKRLRGVCKEMESVFLNLMLSRMRATIPKSGLLGDNQQENIMQSMLDSEMSKNMAQAGGIGLADMIYRQLTLPTLAAQKNQAPSR